MKILTFNVRNRYGIKNYTGIYKGIDTVKNLSDYLINTSNDLLTWVSSNNKLLNNTEVKYKDKTTKTNENGIAIIKNYNDLSKVLKYVEIGKDNPVYVGVNNDDNDSLY